MFKTRCLSLLLGGALISSSGALAVAQDAVAAATGKGSSESEASATVEKAGKKAAPELAAASTAEARGTTEESAEIKRGLASLKSGTAISTQLDQAIDASKAKPGDIVSAKVTKDIKRDGRTVIRKGDRLLGRVTSAEAGAKGQAGSELGVTFDRLARGDAEYQLNTVVSSVISTSGDMGAGIQNSPLDEPMMMPGPVTGGGGRAGGGGGLLGGVTSTVGSAVSATGSAAGGLAGNVGGTASSAVGSAGTAAGASEHGSAQSGSRAGLSTPVRDIRLNSQTGASQNGETTSVLAARRGNLRLDSGTRMQFKVSNQTEAEAAKK